MITRKPPLPNNEADFFQIIAASGISENQFLRLGQFFNYTPRLASQWLIDNKYWLEDLVSIRAVYDNTVGLSVGDISFIVYSSEEMWETLMSMPKWAQALLSKGH